MSKSLNDILQEDIEGLWVANKQYGGSWMKRGGVGAFMMLARKWDRIEQKWTNSTSKDLLEIIKEDTRSEGIIDDIRDLRRYLLLVESYLEYGNLYMSGLELIKLRQPVTFYSEKKEEDEVDSSTLYEILRDYWNMLQDNCKEKDWNILKKDKTIENCVNKLRLLLCDVEVLFSALGIDPKHRDNK